jgi:predicted RNA-binding protein YlxR (DUF448 family)
VRFADGRVSVDTTGKMNGRGAYLCPAQECWVTAQRKGSLDHALKSRLSPENWSGLLEYAQSLPEHKVLKRADRLARTEDVENPKVLV